MIIRNGDVLHVDRMEVETDLRIADGLITGIGDNRENVDDKEVIDATGCFVLPGFIDIHTHGLKDVLVDDGSFVDYSRLQYEQGVTSCLPTLGGSPQQNVDTMKRADLETSGFERTPNLIGFRPEIMYLADASAGNPESLAPITEEVSRSVYEAGRGKIRIWDVSPELPGALEFIRWAQKLGVITSLAHSNALEEVVRSAVDAGMSLVTHFYDLFPLAVETDEGVYPAGVTDYINLEDRLTVEIIPDGVHVHPYLVEQTLRVKEYDRVIFVTDSALGSGNEPGIYEGLYPGIRVEVTEDRGIRRVGDDLLSCSALTMLAGFRNTVMKFGKSLSQASRLCSRNAARLLNLSGKGYIARGMDADVAVLDRDFTLVRTIARGKTVYTR